MTAGSSRDDKIVPCGSPAAGGVEKLVTDLAWFSDRSKFEVSVLNVIQDTYWPEEEMLTETSIKVYTTDMTLSECVETDRWKRYLYYIKTMSRIWKIIKNLKPSIIHTHGYVQHLVLIPAVLQNIPVRIHTIRGVVEEAGLPDKNGSQV